jgi:DNA-binding NtrC family response regulator
LGFPPESAYPIRLLNCIAMTDFSKIRVLIVDDEPSVRLSLTSFLEDYGFQTASCSSTEEARDLMRDRPFDVCVVDLRLPGLSGEDLILLAHRHFPGQRFIIHTASLSYNLPDSLRALGIREEHVFHKPIRALTMLVNRIKELADHPETQMPDG